MMKKVSQYKVNFTNKLLSLSILLISDIVFLSAGYYLSNNRNYKVLLYSLYFIIPITLLTLYNYLNYIKVNYLAKLAINLESDEIIYSDKYKHKSIHIKEVEKIIVVSTWDSNGFNHKMPWFDFHYCKIIFKKEKPLIITSLLIRNIPKELDKLGLEYEKKFNWFMALIKKEDIRNQIQSKLL
ncbi:MAG: hypothetical protein NT007_02815 [Candidatus Kapabacteria bacterium]|nr:hypothetical protein [Candidatus Kapabacteria bacterium]